jgi:hypothetical protein
MAGEADAVNAGYFGDFGVGYHLTRVGIAHRAGIVHRCPQWSGMSAMASSRFFNSEGTATSGAAAPTDPRIQAQLELIAPIRGRAISLATILPSGDDWSVVSTIKVVLVVGACAMNEVKPGREPSWPSMGPNLARASP